MKKPSRAGRKEPRDETLRQVGWAAVLLLVVFLMYAPQRARAQSPALVLAHANVIDGSGAAVREDVTVVLRDGASPQSWRARTSLKTEQATLPTLSTWRTATYCRACGTTTPTCRTFFQTPRKRSSTSRCCAPLFAAVATRWMRYVAASRACG